MVVLVTGAARGMGRSMSLGLAREGIEVVLVDNLSDELAKTADDVAQLGGRRPLTSAMDVTDEVAVAAVIDKTMERFGRINALVNNAGIGQATIRRDQVQRPIDFWEITPEQWRHMLNVNINGFFLMTRAAVRAMLPSRSGRIIAVTTSLDTMIRRGSAPYGGSKAAIEATMATLADDLADTGLTANVLVPGGMVDTVMIPTESGLDRSKMIRPDIMVPPLLWLLSNDAAKISGHRILARLWDANLPPDQAFKASSAPTAWPQLGVQSVAPPMP